MNPFWLIFLVVGVLYEAWAIITDKKDTASEQIWKLMARHWIFRVIVGGIMIWGFFHLTFGPCAFGLC
jgi:succinate dehydrogenase/fumarate reductase cytochrome b subunit